MDPDYRNGIIGNLDKDWVVFFATFGRFEYAMKRAGYLVNKESGSRAIANWDAFAGDLGEGFLDFAKGTSSLAIFFEAAPQRHMVSATQTLEWQKRQPIVLTQDLFQAARDIRNSLFHGEKSILRERDRELVAAALILLDHAWVWTEKLSESNAKLGCFRHRFPFH